jgi:hypothetical protein
VLDKQCFWQKSCRSVQLTLGLLSDKHAHQEVINRNIRHPWRRATSTLAGGWLRWCPDPPWVACPSGVPPAARGRKYGCCRLGATHISDTCCAPGEAPPLPLGIALAGGAEAGWCRRNLALHAHQLRQPSHLLREEHQAGLHCSQPLPL